MVENKKKNDAVFIGAAVYVILVSLISGLLYLFKPTFMPYHAQVLACSWDSLSAGHKILHLALMRVVGMGFLCVCVAVGVLAWRAHHHREKWAGLLAGILSVMMFGIGVYADLIIAIQTGSTPPWYGTMSGLVASLGVLTIAVIQTVRSVHIKQSDY